MCVMCGRDKSGPTHVTNRYSIALYIEAAHNEIVVVGKYHHHINYLTTFLCIDIYLLGDCR